MPTRNHADSAASILFRTFSIDGQGAHTLIKLLRANGHDPDLNRLAYLAVGESHIYGGGAAARFTITRLT